MKCRLKTALRTYQKFSNDSAVPSSPMQSLTYHSVPRDQYCYRNLCSSNEYCARLLNSDRRRVFQQESALLQEYRFGHSAWSRSCLILRPCRHRLFHMFRSLDCIQSTNRVRLQRERNLCHKIPHRNKTTVPLILRQDSRLSHCFTEMQLAFKQDQ